jgi:hypothetical protein
MASSWCPSMLARARAAPVAATIVVPSPAILRALSTIFSVIKAVEFGFITRMRRCPHVRRAFAAQHIVELRPDCVAFVATFSPQEPREVIEARRRIERALARHAVERANSEDINYMRDTLVKEA